MKQLCNRQCWHKYSMSGKGFCDAFYRKPKNMWKCKGYVRYCRTKQRKEMLGPEWPIMGGGYGR